MFPSKPPSWMKVIVLTVSGGLISLLAAILGPPWMAHTFLGTMICFLAAYTWQLAVHRNSIQPSVLETPLYLAHDAEVFDRYRRVSQHLLRTSSRADPIFRKSALDKLDSLIGEVSRISDGTLVFEDTEAWRLVYEQLLRDPRVTTYRSVALIRDPAYWQDGAGHQSMKLNYQLLAKSIVTVERTMIIADELWPPDAVLPSDVLRPWIHEQSVNGIWVRLVREADLSSELDLVCDMGIYGVSAVGIHDIAENQLRTSRFTLDFDFQMVREAEERWKKLNVYATSYEDLLDQFRRNE